MRFLELYLKAFGPFTERRIELDAQSGIHLFHGPNEAGKSSMLRAVRDMLFGFDRSTMDNHLHDNQELRVGAVLQSSDGQRLEFLRRKGNKNTLLDSFGGALHDDALAPFLGNVDQDLFLRLYGLNHETLVRGGKALLQDDGDVGQSLLSASLGPGLRRVVNSLRGEAEELWRPRAQKDKVNTALRDLKEARSRMNKATLLPQTWTKNVKELSEITKDVSTLVERKRQLEKDIQRLERHSKAIPLLVRYRELRAAQDKLPDTPELHETFTERRKTYQRELAQFRQSVKALGEKASRHQAQLAELPHQTELLQVESRLTELLKQVENYRSSESQLNRLASQSEELETQANILASDLKPGVDLESLVLPPAALRHQVAELALRYRESRTSLKLSEDELSRSRAELLVVKKQVEDLGPILDLGPLERVSSDLQQEAKIDDDISDLEAKVAQQQRLVNNGCAQLPLWDGTAEALLDLKLPLMETITEADSQFVSLEHKLETQETKHEELNSDLAELESELTLARGEEDLPTQLTLKEARDQREQSWVKVVAECRGGSVPTEDQLSHYHDQVQDSDLVADRMFKSASKVTQILGLEQNSKAISEKLEELRVQKEATQRELELLQQNWKMSWSSLGAEPLSPKAMRSWIERRGEVLADLEVSEQLSRELARFSKRRSALIVQVTEVLSSERDRSSRKCSSLAEARKQIHAVLEPLKLATSKREKLTEEFSRLEMATQKLEATCQRLRKAVSEEHEEWSRKVEQLNADPALEPSELSALLTSFEDLRALQKRLAELSVQEAVCRSEKERFESSTEQLVKELNLGPNQEEPAALVERLSQELQTAKQQEQSRGHLEKALAELEEERLELGQGMSQAQAHLEQMRVEAGASTLDELPEIELRSRQYQEICQKLEPVKAGLLGLSAGLGLEVFCEEIELADADLIPSLIEERKVALGELEEQRDALKVRQGELQALQSQSDGSGLAAEAAADAQEAMARTREGVERYMILSLAEHLLVQEMEQYRLSHQGPLIAFASRSFAKLTLGIYSRLEIGFDNKDKPILLACEKDNRKVGISGLSDGTRDQLFLALRLAAIEHGLEHREPIPFVADDLFVHFDRERAGAALELLADFSQKTQVLFFTHLDRDRDLALELLGDRVSVHQLERALLV